LGRRYRERRLAGDHGGESPRTTHTHFHEQERLSSVMSTLLALGIVTAIAFWLVLLPY
jgi:hypothetical protein